MNIKSTLSTFCLVLGIVIGLTGLYNSNALWIAQGSIFLIAHALFQHYIFKEYIEGLIEEDEANSNKEIEESLNPKQTINFESPFAHIKRENKRTIP